MIEIGCDKCGDSHACLRTLIALCRCHTPSPPFEVRHALSQRESDKPIHFRVSRRRDVLDSLKTGGSRFRENRTSHEVLRATGIAALARGVSESRA
jgi:hypothetical protein